LVRLTVSYADEVVEIAFDREGLDHLIGALTNLQGVLPPDHDHLMSEEWGSHELTTDGPGLGTVAHELRLQFDGEEGGRDEIGSRGPVRREL
jgi:hypothetical protein